MLQLPTTSTRVSAGFLCLLMLSVFSFGCLWNQPVERRYYSLVQPSPARSVDEVLDVDIWVREVGIASVYDRPQLVFRHSPTELRYFAYERWADRPRRMFSQHLVQTLRGAGCFRSVTDRLGTTPPEYVLDSTVIAMEQLDGGDVWFAHLAMTFRLTRFGENETLWEYSFSERRPLHDGDVALTVRAISEILGEELETVVDQLEAKLSGRPIPDDSPKRRPPESPPADSISEPSDPATENKEQSSVEAKRPALLGDGAGRAFTWGGEPVNWRRSTQYTSDPTVVPPSKGAVFLPALGGDPEREPLVEVMEDDRVVASGPMGRRIPLNPGSYEVHFGSGALSQRMVREVHVREGEVRVVEPDWAALEISIFDDNFIPWRGSYEVKDRVRAEYVGLGYGADEELGERTQVWVLRPGIYKIVQPGASHRTRTNFATVQLPPGSMVPFVIVMDPATNDFLGSGVADPEDEGTLAPDERWTLRSSVGGDFFWNSRSGQDTEVGTELALTFFSDNLARFQMEPHLWTTRLEIEESHRLVGRTASDGTRESLLAGEFEPVIDRAYLNTLYIYELLSWAGPYARVGGETSLFHRYRSPGSEQEVFIFGEDGTELLDVFAAGEKDRVRMAGSLSPLEFKEGVGVNFRVLRHPNIDVDLRVGLGARQYLSLGQLLVNEERSSDLDALVLERASNSFLLGPETTVVASVRLTRYLQGTTEFDALVPFGGEDRTRYTWRNSASLRLSNFASLVYTVNLDQNPNVGREEPLHFDQGLRLRLTFVLF